MNVWFHSNQNDWEEEVIARLIEKNIWKNVYNTNGNIPNNPYGLKNYLLDINPDHTRILPDDLYQEMYPYLYEFMDMYSRNNKNDQNSYLDLNVHEYLNLFNLILQYYYYQYTTHNIDLIFLNRAPHVGYDFLSYHLAQKMGLKTLILEQSKFPNRFFYYWNNSDYGTFKTSQVKFEHPYISIEKKFEKDLVYMKNIGEKNLKNRRDIYKQFPIIRLFRELFDKDLRPGAYSKYYKELIFKKSLKSTVLNQEAIDFDHPYIYFGLHKQPEKTTSAWGGIYNDQVLAIEQLSNKLPDGWKIYVKENPKQGYYMRDKYFYQRIKKIPHVTMVNKNTDTYKLLKNCKIAATITGTIGWECITGGKPVIHFGWGTWYKSFNGVYQYHDTIDLQAIVNEFEPLTKEEIEKNLNILLDYSGEGIIYNKGWYKDIYEHYNYEDNINNIVNSLSKILHN